MLNAIRGKLGSFVVLALLGLLIASFALWGIPDLFINPAGRAVAKVGDSEITATAFDRAFTQRMRQLEAQYGQPIDRDQAVAFGLPQQVLEQLVAELAFDEHAHGLGMRVSNRQVLDILKGFEAFAGFDGRFDPQAYKNQLALARITPREFEDSLKRDLVRRQLVLALTAAEPYSEPLAKALFRYRNETRRAAILSLSASSFPDVADPTEEEMRAAYELEKGRYRTPEYRRVAVTEIVPERIADPAAVSEEDIRAAYENRVAEFQSPELRALQVATFGLNDQAKAESFLSRVAGGEDFGMAVEDMTDFSAAETDLGDVSETDLAQDYNEKIAREIFAAEAGAFVGPVQSVFGWHVFRVKSVTAPVVRTLSEVSERLRGEIANERATDAVYDISVKAEEALARGAGLNEIAETLDLHPVIAEITREGMTRDGSDADPAILNHLARVWSMGVDDPVALEQVGDGGFALVDVLEVIPPEQMPYEDVANAIRDNLLAERRLAAAGEVAEQLAARLRAGESPAEVAASSKAVLVVSDWVARSEIAQGSKVAPVVGRLMFDLEPGGVAVERNANGDGYVVLRLEDMRPGDRAFSPAEYDAARIRLSRSLLEDALYLYEAGLRDDFGVTINSKLFSEIVRPQGGL